MTEEQQALLAKYQAEHPRPPRRTLALKGESKIGSESEDNPTWSRFDGQKRRREIMRLLRICINASFSEYQRSPRPSAIEHGPVVGDSGKCERCVQVAKESRARSELKQRELDLAASERERQREYEQAHIAA